MGAGKLKAQWQMVTEQVGPFKSIVDVQLESQDGFTGVVLNCAFERKNVKVIPWFDDQSRIVRLFYDPR
jgi:hypothetical protein